MREKQVVGRVEKIVVILPMGPWLSLLASSEDLQLYDPELEAVRVPTGPLSE